jgi:hypothetical protein
MLRKLLTRYISDEPGKLVMIVVVIAVIIGLLYIAGLLIMRSDKKNEQLAKEFEEKHPAKPGKEEDLAFGALFINATSQLRKPEPVRSLEMLFLGQKLDVLRDKDLAKWWDVRDTVSAKETLKALQERHMTSENQDLEQDLKAAIAKHTIKPTTATENYPSNWSTVDKISFYILPKLIEMLDRAFEADYESTYSWKELSSVTDFAAWDIERLAGMARKCYVAGYITEAECYEYLEEAKKQAQAHYHGWREYFLGFIYGRALLYHLNSVTQYTKFLPEFLGSKDSIWKENEQVWKESN